VSALGASVRLDAVDLGAELPTDSLWEFVRRSGLRSLVICDSKNPNAKYSVLLIAPDGRPQMAVKVATTATAGLAIEAERLALLEMEASWPGLAGVPRVLDAVNFDGRHSLVMTAVAGTPMRSSYMRWRHTARRSSVAADFAATESWAAQFQRTTVQGSAPLEMDAGVSARLRGRHAECHGIGADVEAFTEICARLRRHEVARTAVHGDLWAANILLAGGSVSGVVDWETAEPSGVPARDIARFAHMYALFLDRRTREGRRVAGHGALRAGDWGTSVTHAVDGTGWFHELFRRFLQTNLVRLGAPAAIWRDLALAAVAEVAALADSDEYARLHLGLFRTLASRTHGSRMTL
jgi:aminoglycoside phosphotransferase